MRYTGCIRLARAIRGAIEARGRSVTEVAGEIGVDRARLSQWCHAHRRVRVNDLRALERGLDVQFSGVFTRDHSSHHGRVWCRADMTGIGVTCRSTGDTLYDEARCR